MYIKIENERSNEMVKGILEEKGVDFKIYNSWFNLAASEAVNDIIEMSFCNRDDGDDDFPDRVEKLSKEEMVFFKDTSVCYIEACGQGECDFINTVSDKVYQALDDLPQLFRYVNDK